MSSSLGLCINIELRKVKVRISFLGLTDSVIKAVHIRGPELLQDGVRVTIFTDRCLLYLTESFTLFSLSSRTFLNVSICSSSSFLTFSDIANFFSMPTF